jgi:histone deacetylase complex regulatory component SIN3
MYEIQKNIENLREILESEKSTKKQIEKFSKLTGLKRRSFFLYKKYILGKTNQLNFRTSYHKSKSNECYFCSTKEKLIVYHINKIREDNKDTNLLTLCASCHRKLVFFWYYSSCRFS